MPEMFGETYDEAVEGWIRERLDEGGAIQDGCLTARDPVTGEEVPLAVNVYADDVGEVMQGEDMEEVVSKIEASSDGFDRALAEVGLSQDLGNIMDGTTGPVTMVTRGWRLWRMGIIRSWPIGAERE